jgi:hypothetical protein
MPRNAIEVVCCQTPSGGRRAYLSIDAMLMWRMARLQRPDDPKHIPTGDETLRLALRSRWSLARYADYIEREARHPEVRSGVCRRPDGSVLLDALVYGIAFVTDPLDRLDAVLGPDGRLVRKSLRSRIAALSESPLCETVFKLMDLFDDQKAERRAPRRCPGSARLVERVDEFIASHCRVGDGESCSAADFYLAYARWTSLGTDDAPCCNPRLVFRALFDRARCIVDVDARMVVASGVSLAIGTRSDPLGDDGIARCACLTRASVRSDKVGCGPRDAERSDPVQAEAPHDAETPPRAASAVACSHDAKASCALGGDGNGDHQANGPLRHGLFCDDSGNGSNGDAQGRASHSAEHVDAAIKEEAALALSPPPRCSATKKRKRAARCSTDEGEEEEDDDDVDGARASKSRNRRRRGTRDRWQRDSFCARGSNGGKRSAESMRRSECRTRPLPDRPTGRERGTDARAHGCQVDADKIGRAEQRYNAMLVDYAIARSRQDVPLCVWCCIAPEEGAEHRWHLVMATRPGADPSRPWHLTYYDLSRLVDPASQEAREDDEKGPGWTCIDREYLRSILVDMMLSPRTVLTAWPHADHAQDGGDAPIDFGRSWIMAVCRHYVKHARETPTGEDGDDGMARLGCFLADRLRRLHDEGLVQDTPHAQECARLLATMDEVA